jgi:hypothetical protein
MTKYNEMAEKFNMATKHELSIIEEFIAKFFYIIEIYTRVIPYQFEQTISP